MAREEIMAEAGPQLQQMQMQMQQNPMMAQNPQMQQQAEQVKQQIESRIAVPIGEMGFMKMASEAVSP